MTWTQLNVRIVSNHLVANLTIVLLCQDVLVAFDQLIATWNVKKVIGPSTAQPFV